jgi:uncharacterized protein (TIGR00725 family)
MKTSSCTYIGVIGGSICTQNERKRAYEAGSLIAKEGWSLVCGGMGGVMEAACRGAFEAGGVTIGIIPGRSHGEGNRYLRYEIVTGLDEARNCIVARTSHAILAIGGGFGTLSELAFAGIAGVPVIGLETLEIDPVSNKGLSVLARAAGSPVEAVEFLRDALKSRFR